MAPSAKHRQFGAILAPNWRQMALLGGHRQFGAKLAPNWRHLAIAANLAPLGANLALTVFPEEFASPRGGTAKYRQHLAIYNRHVAPRGATWRHLAPNCRQLGANLAPNWRQCAVAKFWRHLAPINRHVSPRGAKLAPRGANLAPKSANDLNYHTTKLSMPTPLAPIITTTY